MRQPCRDAAAPSLSQESQHDFLVHYCRHETKTSSTAGAAPCLRPPCLARGEAGLENPLRVPAAELAAKAAAEDLPPQRQAIAKMPFSPCQIAESPPVGSPLVLRETQGLVSPPNAETREAPEASVCGDAQNGESSAEAVEGVRSSPHSATRGATPPPAVATAGEASFKASGEQLQQPQEAPTAAEPSISSPEVNDCKSREPRTLRGGLTASAFSFASQSSHPPSRRRSLSLAPCGSPPKRNFAPSPRDEEASNAKAAPPVYRHSAPAAVTRTFSSAAAPHKSSRGTAEEALGEEDCARRTSPRIGSEALCRDEKKKESFSCAPVVVKGEVVAPLVSAQVGEGVRDVQEEEERRGAGGARRSGHAFFGRRVPSLRQLQHDVGAALNCWRHSVAIWAASAAPHSAVGVLEGGRLCPGETAVVLGRVFGVLKKEQRTRVRRNKRRQGRGPLSDGRRRSSLSQPPSPSAQILRLAEEASAPDAAAESGGEHPHQPPTKLASSTVTSATTTAPAAGRGGSYVGGFFPQLFLSSPPTAPSPFPWIFSAGGVGTRLAALGGGSLRSEPPGPSLVRSSAQSLGSEDSASEDEGSASEDGEESGTLNLGRFASLGAAHQTGLHPMSPVVASLSGEKAQRELLAFVGSIARFTYRVGFAPLFRCCSERRRRPTSEAEASAAIRLAAAKSRRRRQPKSTAATASSEGASGEAVQEEPSGEAALLERNWISITSDVGWGCTIRAAQMLLLQGLRRHFFEAGPRAAPARDVAFTAEGTHGRNQSPETTTASEGLGEAALLSWFLDRPSPPIAHPFSIHGFVRAAGGGVGWARELYGHLPAEEEVLGLEGDVESEGGVKEDEEEERDRQSSRESADSQCLMAATSGGAPPELVLDEGLSAVERRGLGKFAGEWFGPTTASAAMKLLVETSPQTKNEVYVHVDTDGLLDCAEVDFQCRRSHPTAPKKRAPREPPECKARTRVSFTGRGGGDDEWEELCFSAGTAEDSPAPSLEGEEEVATAGVGAGEGEAATESATVCEPDLGVQRAAAAAGQEEEVQENVPREELPLDAVSSTAGGSDSSAAIEGLSPLNPRRRSSHGPLPLSVSPLEQNLLRSEEASARWARGCLLLFPLKVSSGDRINPVYVPSLLAYLSLPWSLGMLGGKSQQAFYCIGFQGDCMLYLDPHSRIQAPATKVGLEAQLSLFGAKPWKQGMAVLNASFALAFYVGCPEQLLQLKREIHRIEQSHEVSCLSVRDPQSLKPGSGASSSGRRRDGSAREGDCTEERKSSREPSTQTGRAGPLSFLETKVAAPTNDGRAETASPFEERDTHRDQGLWRSEGFAAQRRASSEFRNAKNEKRSTRRASLRRGESRPPRKRSPSATAVGGGGGWLSPSSSSSSSYPPQTNSRHPALPAGGDGGRRRRSARRRHTCPSAAAPTALEGCALSSEGFVLLQSRKAAAAKRASLAATSQRIAKEDPSRATPSPAWPSELTRGRDGSAPREDSGNWRKRSDEALLEREATPRSPSDSHGLGRRRRLLASRETSVEEKASKSLVAASEQQKDKEEEQLMRRRRLLHLPLPVDVCGGGLGGSALSALSALAETDDFVQLPSPAAAARSVGSRQGWGSPSASSLALLPRVSESRGRGRERSSPFSSRSLGASADGAYRGGGRGGRRGDGFSPLPERVSLESGASMPGPFEGSRAEWLPGGAAEGGGRGRGSAGGVLRSLLVSVPFLNYGANAARWSVGSSSRTSSAEAKRRCARRTCAAKTEAEARRGGPPDFGFPSGATSELLKPLDVHSQSAEGAAVSPFEDSRLLPPSAPRSPCIHWKESPSTPDHPFEGGGKEAAETQLPLFDARLPHWRPRNKPAAPSAHLSVYAQLEQLELLQSKLRREMELVHLQQLRLRSQLSETPAESLPLESLSSRALAASPAALLQGDGHRTPETREELRSFAASRGGKGAAAPLCRLGDSCAADLGWKISSEAALAGLRGGDGRRRRPSPFPWQQRGRLQFCAGFQRRTSSSSSSRRLWILCKGGGDCCEEGLTTRRTPNEAFPTRRGLLCVETQRRASFESSEASFPEWVPQTGTSANTEDEAQMAGAAAPSRTISSPLVALSAAESFPTPSPQNTSSPFDDGRLASFAALVDGGGKGEAEKAAMERERCCEGEASAMASSSWTLPARPWEDDARRQTQPSRGPTGGRRKTRRSNAAGAEFGGAENCAASAVSWTRQAEGATGAVFQELGRSRTSGEEARKAAALQAEEQRLARRRREKEWRTQRQSERVSKQAQLQQLNVGYSKKLQSRRARQAAHEQRWLHSNPLPLWRPGEEEEEEEEETQGSDAAEAPQDAARLLFESRVVVAADAASDLAEAASQMGIRPWRKRHAQGRIAREETRACAAGAGEADRVAGEGFGLHGGGSVLEVSAMRTAANSPRRQPAALDVSFRCLQESTSCSSCSSSPVAACEWNASLSSAAAAMFQSGQQAAGGRVEALSQPPHPSQPQHHPHQQHEHSNPNPYQQHPLRGFWTETAPSRESEDDPSKRPLASPPVHERLSSSASWCWLRAEVAGRVHPPQLGETVSQTAVSCEEAHRLLASNPHNSFTRAAEDRGEEEFCGEVETHHPHRQTPQRRFGEPTSLKAAQQRGESPRRRSAFTRAAAIVHG